MVEIQQPGGGGGTPISFGDPTQIPYVNATGDDFDYSTDLTWNDSTKQFVVGGKATFEDGMFTPWTRTLIVDQGGHGDYTTIKAACDYVATQTRSLSLPWQILVYTGLYLESPFTIPTFTTVNGFVPTTLGNYEAVTINMTTTFTTGTGITMNSTSNLANLNVFWGDYAGNQTGDIDLVLATGNNKITGVFLSAFTLDAATITALKVTGGVLYTKDLTIGFDNFGAGGARGIYETGGNFDGIYDKTRVYTFYANHWCYEKDTTAGSSRIYNSMFEGPSSIKRTGAGAVTIRGTSYVLNSGTITYSNAFAVADEAYAVGWNGSQEVPTKNALYDKIETLALASDLSSYVPFTGATADVLLGTFDLVTNTLRTPAGLGDNLEIIGDDTVTIDATTGAVVIRGATTVGLSNDGGSHIASIDTTSQTADRTLTTPDADGTIALTSDITGTNSGTNTGDQTLANTSDATSHTVTLSATGGSVQLVEGTNITLDTTGTADDGIITINATGGGSGLSQPQVMARISIGF